MSKGKSKIAVASLGIKWSVGTCLTEGLTSFFSGRWLLAV